MQLTPEQADILNGKKGETMAKVMETLVMFGDIFGAKRMVEVTHKEGHLVTSFGIGLLKPPLQDYGQAHCRRHQDARHFHR